jgi:polysaccharide biosynthesis transport protein
VIASGPETTADEEGFDLRIYWGILTRTWWVFLIGVLLGTGALYMLSRGVIPSYESTAIIQVQSGGTPGSLSSSDFQSSVQLARTLTAIGATRNLLDGTAASLGYSSGGAVAGKVTIDDDASLLTVSARDPDAQVAADIANAAARVLIDDYRIKQLSEIAGFQAALAQYGIGDEGALIAAQVASYNALRLIEDAVSSESPSSSGLRARIAMGALLGLVLAGLLVFIKEHLDDRVRSEEEFARLTGTPGLGLIAQFADGPKGQSIFEQQQTDRQLSESLKFVQTNLEFAAVAGELRSVMISSATPMEGKSTMASHLAVSVAREGKSVILVDGDLRRPSVHTVLGLAQQQKGLSHLLVGAVQVQDVLTPTELPLLRVIAAGTVPPDASQLLRSPLLSKLVAELEQQADLVIFDSPPALAVTDTTLLGGVVDGILMIVDSTRTRRKLVAESFRMLSRTGTPILGGLVNKVAAKRSRYGYYGYGYGEDWADNRIARGKGRFSFVRRAVRRVTFRAG